MDVQLLVWLDKPEITEAGGVGQTHTRSDLFPTRIVGEVLVRAILVGKNWIRPIAGQRHVEISLDGSIEVDLTLIYQLHYRVREYSLCEGRPIHDCVRGQRISLDITDPV